MDRDNEKIINIRRVAFKNGVVTGGEKERVCSGLGLPISKPKDIPPVSSSPSYEFAPKKIEITQSTQQAQSLDFREFEDGGGVFAARLDENYNYYTESLQGPLTLLPHQVRETLYNVNWAKKNLKIPETISKEVEIEEPYRVINNRIMQPRAKKNLKIPETISEEVEIKEPDSVNDDQMPKTSCCVLSCSCLKKLIPRKSAKIAISNQNLSVSLAIATDLSEVQTDREKDDNDREKEVTV